MVKKAIYKAALDDLTKECSSLKKTNNLTYQKLEMQEYFKICGRGTESIGTLNPVRFLLHDNSPANALNPRIIIFSTEFFHSYPW